MTGQVGLLAFDSALVLRTAGQLVVVLVAVGLSLGVLTTASSTVVLLMALVTTAMAPPLLRVLSRSVTRDTAYVTNLG